MSVTLHVKMQTGEHHRSSSSLVESSQATLGRRVEVAKRVPARSRSDEPRCGAAVVDLSRQVAAQREVRRPANRVPQTGFLSEIRYLPIMHRPPAMPAENLNGSIGRAAPWSLYRRAPLGLLLLALRSCCCSLAALLVRTEDGFQLPHLLSDGFSIRLEHLQVVVKPRQFLPRSLQLLTHQVQESILKAVVWSIRAFHLCASAAPFRPPAQCGELAVVHNIITPWSEWRATSAHSGV